MKIALLRKAALSSLLFSLSACSSADPEISAAFSDADIGLLEGRNWSLNGLAGDEVLPKGIQVTARFEQGRLSGSAGCNNYFASYNLGQAGALSIDMPASTRKMCRGSAMEVERQFLSVLPRVRRFKVAAEDLALVYLEADVEKLLKFSE